VHVEDQENQNKSVSRHHRVRRNDVNEDTAAIKNHGQTEYNEDDQDELSVENESYDNAYISINDFKTVEQMNTAQINTNPENGNKLPETNEGWRTMTSHRYNL